MSDDRVVHEEKVSYKKTAFKPVHVVENERFLGGLSIMDCRGLKFVNCEIDKELEFMSSYGQEFGLWDIEFNNCWIHDAVTDRLGMMGGSNIGEIRFIGNRIERCIGGTHLVYMSGGHWLEEFPPIPGIVFDGNYLSLAPAGRHLLQFNGRFIKGEIKNNIFAHGQLCGLSLIGCQGFEVANNVFYGSNRGGLVLFDYADSWAHLYNWFRTDADIDHFLKTHHPNQDINVHHNTFVQGPKQFSVDPWHWDDPQDGHGAITINNGVHSGFSVNDPGDESLDMRPEYMEPPPRPSWRWVSVSGTPGDGYRPIQFDFPNKDIRVHHNIIWTPNRRVMAVGHTHEAKQTVFNDNMVCYPLQGVPYIDHYANLKECVNNWMQDPQFKDRPRYTHVNMGVNPDFDWSEYKTSFDAFSAVGAEYGVGAKT